MIHFPSCQPAACWCLPTVPGNAASLSIGAQSVRAQRMANWAVLRLVTGFARLLRCTLQPRNYSRLTLEHAGAFAWKFGARILPGYCLLLMGLGALLGWQLFPALTKYKGLLDGAPLAYSIFTFELVPLMAAMWFAMFAVPGMGLNSIERRRVGEGAYLREVGVDEDQLLSLPVFLGTFMALFLLSVLGMVFLFLASLVTWTFTGGVAYLPIEWWSSGVDLKLVIAFPLKIWLLAAILSQVPLRAVERYRSIEQLAQREGFFGITAWILSLIMFLELIWLIWLRL